MDESSGLGLMAVCAVSGSMVLLVHHVHKHLFSNFMKKIEFEMVGFNAHPKHKHQKKLRSCKVASLSPKTKDARRKVTKTAIMDKERMVLAREDFQKWRSGPRLEDMMPPNRAVLYKGIIKYRTRMGKFDF